jgi:hypothetical protein
MAGHNWRRRPRLAVVLLFAVGGSALGWVWATGRSTTPSFPQPLLSTESLLLAALVFFLGLGQGNLRRAAESVVAELRRLETTLRDSHRDDSRPMPTFRLFEWAAAVDHETEGARALKWSEMRDLSRQHAGLVRSRYALLGDLLSLSRIDRDLRLNDGEPGTRRRTDLEGERDKLNVRRRAALANLRKVEKLTGVTGEAVLSGRLRLAVGAASDLLTLVVGSVSVMVLLAAIGFTYAGWATGSPRPEFWAVAALLGLAISYATVVIRDIKRELTIPLDALETSWLTCLYQAEQLLCALGGASAYSEAFKKDLLRRAAVKLQWAERADPTLPWLLSLRGRAELYEAVEHAGLLGRYLADTPDDTVSRRRETDALSRHLSLAEPLLRKGACRKDDPVSAVALARALELTATYVGGDEAAQEAEADGLVEGAVLELRNHRLARTSYKGNRVGAGPSLAWNWLHQQVWLWPSDERRAGALTALEANASGQGS